MRNFATLFILVFLLNFESCFVKASLVGMLVDFPFYMHIRARDEILAESRMKHIDNLLLFKLCPDQKNNTKLQRVLDDFWKCTKGALNLNETFCNTALGDEFQECAKPVIAAFEECTDVKMKKMPQFFAKEFISIFDYICNLSVEDILEFLHPCWLDNPKTTRDHNNLIKESPLCRNSVRNLDNLRKPSVEEICRVLDDLRPCIENYIKLLCASPNTLRVTSGLIEAIQKPCNIIQP